MGLLAKKGGDKYFDSGEVVSVIGPEAYFQGTLTVKGSLRVDGRVEGTVSEAKAVIIGSSGRIIGDVSAESAVVGGEVKGNLSAVKYTELLSGARVIGDIRTARIMIEEGAFFDGQCSMINPGDESQPGQGDSGNSGLETTEEL